MIMKLAVLTEILFEAVRVKIKRADMCRICLYQSDFVLTKWILGYLAKFKKSILYFWGMGPDLGYN